MWVNIHHKLYNLDKFDTIKSGKTANGKTYLSLSYRYEHEVKIQMTPEDITLVMMGITSLAGGNYELIDSK
tara:strand:+ start:88 stop:300 length:213 start_codon:yes stop_codon:yes gene_type:complete